MCRVGKLPQLLHTITCMKVTIIYNPKSTGDSKKNAEALKRAVKRDTAVLVPTKSAGHAEEIAYELALKNKPVVIVASSGDGGYHEVINGIMRSGNKAVIAGTIPSGNANDHHRNAYSQAVSESINDHQFKKIDLIQLKATINKQEIINRYAHSYIGFGLTSDVAVALNEGAKTNLKEKLAALKKLVGLSPFSIVMNDKFMRLDSLLASNIPEMAKKLTVASNIKPDDGTFGLTMHAHQSKLNLINYFMRSRLDGQSADTRETKVTFQLIKKAKLQMDGEVYKLPAGCTVTIMSTPKALTTFK